MLRGRPTIHICGLKRSTARRRAPGSMRAMPRPRLRFANGTSMEYATCCRPPQRARSHPLDQSARALRLQISGRTRRIPRGSGGARRWRATAATIRNGKCCSTSTRLPRPKAELGLAQAASHCRPSTGFGLFSSRVAAPMRRSRASSISKPSASSTDSFGHPRDQVGRHLARCRYAAGGRNARRRAVEDHLRLSAHGAALAARRAVGEPRLSCSRPGGRTCASAAADTDGKPRTIVIRRTRSSMPSSMPKSMAAPCNRSAAEQGHIYMGHDWLNLNLRHDWASARHLSGRRAAGDQHRRRSGRQTRLCGAVRARPPASSTASQHRAMWSASRGSTMCARASRSLASAMASGGPKACLGSDLATVDSIACATILAGWRGGPRRPSSSDPDSSCRRRCSWRGPGRRRSAQGRAAAVRCDGLAITQHFAVSVDGTRIPYFQIGRADLPLDGENASLLDGYGGFQVRAARTIRASVGKLWLERGGVYVIANIRGGGEFGPDWHKAGIRRQEAGADDFAAVAGT